MELLRFRKKRRKLKKGVLAIILGFLAAAVAVLFFIVYKGGAEATAQYGSASMTNSYDAVIVRKERIITADEFDLADYFADEGSRVESGDPVMNVYKMGYSKEITLSLWRVRQEIYETQLEVLGEARDVELRTYDSGIEEARSRIAYAVMNGESSLVLGIQNELTELLEARRNYLRGYIQETEALRSLYQREEELEASVNEARTELLAPSAGTVSYYVDDFAIALNADKLSTVTSDLVTSALKRSKNAKWSGSAKTNAYRIVDTGEWYCVFLTPVSEPLRVAEGMKYPVTIDGYGSFEGTGAGSFVSGKKVVNIIRVNDEMGALINVRGVRVKVGFEASDIMVDKRAIQFENGEPYIEVITADGRYGVYVNVLSGDGEHVIVNARSTDNAPIGVGVKYWIPKRK